MGFSGHLDLDRDMPDLGWHPQNSIRSYFPGRRLIPCPQAATGSPKIDLSSEFGLLKLRTPMDFGRFWPKALFCLHTPQANQADRSSDFWIGSRVK